MTAPGEPKIDAPPTPSGWTLTVDGGEPVAVRDVSVSTKAIDVIQFGSMYSMSMPNHETIVVELGKLPCSATSSGVHDLQFRHGEAVQEYKAQLFECEMYSTVPGKSGIDTVRMVWHTVHTLTFKGHYGGSYADSGRMLSKALPALIKEVLSPCDHGGVDLLEAVIIHLNDRHKWSREQIADWLDSLDVDLAFPVPDTIPSSIN